MRAGDGGVDSSSTHQGQACQGQNTAMTPSDMAGDLPRSPELIRAPPLGHVALGLVPAPGLSPTGPGDLPAACLPDTPAPVTAWPQSGEWGRDDRWWRCLSNQSLRQLRNKRKPSRTWGSVEPSYTIPSLILNPPVPTVCRRKGTPWPISCQNGSRPNSLSIVLTAQSPMDSGAPQQQAT